MFIRPFNPNTDIKYIPEWGKARNLSDLGLPVAINKGFIAFNRETPIACGFFLDMDGGYLLADSFITNPHAAPKLRDEALDRLFAKMIKVAKHYRRMGILTFSEDFNTIARCSKHGFKLQPHKVLTLGL